MQYPFWGASIVLLKYLLTIAAKIRQKMESKEDIWGNSLKPWHRFVHEHQFKSDRGRHHHACCLSPFLRFFLLLVFISCHEGSLAVLKRCHTLRALGHPPRQRRWVQHCWHITLHWGENATSPCFWLQVSAQFTVISISCKIKVYFSIRRWVGMSETSMAEEWQSSGSSLVPPWQFCLALHNCKSGSVFQYRIKSRVV